MLQSAAKNKYIDILPYNYKNINPLVFSVILPIYNWDRSVKMAFFEISRRLQNEMMPQTVR